MLKNIKSIVILKKVFSYLRIKRKFDLIKHNKIIQNRLDINLLDYKIYSGKYIVYEEKGKAKEFSVLTNNLVFEGGYLNGRRNGKGKEYYNYENENHNKHLKFEGNYLNGKRHGKGIKYYLNGEIKFKGEYLNGNKWTGNGYDQYSYDEYKYQLNNGQGIVKKFDRRKNIKFEGHYLNGKKNGLGIEYDFLNKIQIFKGEYLNGKRWNGFKIDENKNVIFDLKNGNGFIRYGDKYKSRSEYLNGERNGVTKEYHSTDYFSYLRFEGEYINGKKNGKGKEYDRYRNVIYEGEYLNNYRKKGKLYLNGILEYEGEFLVGKKWTGKGYDENGKVIYELIEGTGTIKEYEKDSGEYIPKQLIYEGEMLKGKLLNGIKYKYKDRELIATVEYIEGKIWNGEVEEYNKYDELIFDGEYKNGVRWNGKGIEYSEDGETKYKVTYENGTCKRNFCLIF